MAKKKTKEDLQIELTIRNAELIKQSIKVAHSLNRISKVGPEGIMTSMVFVVGDFLEAMASSLETSCDELTNTFFESIRDYVNEEENKKTKGN